MTDIDKNKESTLNFKKLGVLPYAAGALFLTIFAVGLFISFNDVSISEKNVGISFTEFRKFENLNTTPSLVLPGDRVKVWVELTKDTFTQNGSWGGTVVSLKPMGDFKWTTSEVVKNYPVPTHDSDVTNVKCTPFVEFVVPEGNNIFGKTLKFHVVMDIKATAQARGGQDIFSGPFSKESIARQVNTNSEFKIIGDKEKAGSYRVLIAEVEKQSQISFWLIAVGIVGLFGSFFLFSSKME